MTWPKRTNERSGASLLSSTCRSQWDQRNRISDCLVHSYRDNWRTLFFELNNDETDEEKRLVRLPKEIGKISTIISWIEDTSDIHCTDIEIDLDESCSLEDKDKEARKTEDGNRQMRSPTVRWMYPTSTVLWQIDLFDLRKSLLSPFGRF